MWVFTTCDYEAMLMSAVLGACSLPAWAGESALTTTFQPLDTLGKGGIAIVPVACHHWYSSSAGSSVDLIAVANVPPTDNPKEAKEDLNLASVCGVKFSTSDLGANDGAPLKVTMDVRKFSVPAQLGHPREDIVRACLECLRLCLPVKLLKTPVTLEASESDKAWVAPIVEEFNSSDRSKVFFTPED
jgi:hypothetical protein